jgi:hypothetical protein
MREEKIVFNELGNLCISRGYVHVIAYFCYRDFTIGYSEKLTVERISPQYSKSR